MKISNGINAVNLVKEDANLGFTLLTAVKEYYSETLRKFKKNSDDDDVFQQIMKKKWPFPQKRYEELILVRGTSCAFIVHEEWHKTSFIYGEEIIHLIDSIIASAAKVIGRKVTIEALIGPISGNRAWWNYPEDQNQPIPVMTIREMIAGELSRDIIFSLPPDIIMGRMSSDAHDYIHAFLLGLADQWLPDIESEARDFFEDAPTLKGLFEKIRALTK